MKTWIDRLRDMPEDRLRDAIEHQKRDIEIKRRDLKTMERALEEKVKKEKGTEDEA